MDKQPSLKTIELFATDVLKSSGKIARKYFRNSAQYEIKKDGSIVTIADKKIEQFIRKAIGEKFPRHSIMGEEFKDKKSAGSPYKWVIDPIDGTSSFKAGRPIFGIMLALMKNDKAIMGAVYQPITDELWLGVGGVTKFNGKVLTKEKPAKKAKKTGNSYKIIATTSPELFDKNGKNLWAALRMKSQNAIYGGDCYNYCLLAMGQIDCVYEQALKPHDYLPLLPILQGAGAKIKLTIKPDKTADLMVTRG